MNHLSSFTLKNCDIHTIFFSFFESVGTAVAEAVAEIESLTARVEVVIIVVRIAVINHHHHLDIVVAHPKVSQKKLSKLSANVFYLKF